MAQKKNNYIDFELEWLEKKAEEQRAYVDAHPLETIVDRQAWREMKGGGRMPVVIQTIEAIHKNIRDTLKDYTFLIEAISKLREKEEEKKKFRGDDDLTPMEDGEI